MSNGKAPSRAQAKRIAKLWSDDSMVRIGESYIDPTDRVLVKNGWLVESGETGTFPNGTPYKGYMLSADALDGLEGFLRETRYRRMTAVA